MDLRILFIHPVETERDSFRRACMDEDFKVDTASDMEEAKKLIDEHKYEMIFFNRKLGGEEITSFLSQIRANNPSVECVMGAPTLTKADLLYYQNETGLYHMYLEPVNYRKDLLPLIETFMLEAKARVMGQINQGAKECEGRWTAFQELLVSTLPGKKGSVGHLYAINVLRHYHQMSMTDVMYISELQKEISDSYSNHKELQIKWDIKESARRVLEYRDAVQKLIIARILCQVVCAESIALADGYKTELTILLEGSKGGVHIHSQVAVSRPYKSDDEKINIITNETNGIFEKFCTEHSQSDDTPGGLWIHSQDGIFDA